MLHSTIVRGVSTPPKKVNIYTRILQPYYRDPAIFRVRLLYQARYAVRFVLNSTSIGIAVFIFIFTNLSLLNARVIVASIPFLFPSQRSRCSTLNSVFHKCYTFGNDCGMQIMRVGHRVKHVSLSLLLNIRTDSSRPMQLG